jgi:hypothetical protein
MSWNIEALENRRLIKVIIGDIHFVVVQRDDGRYMAAALQELKSIGELHPFDSYSAPELEIVMERFWKMVREEFLLQNDGVEFVPPLDAAA